MGSQVGFYHTELFYSRIVDLSGQQTAVQHIRLISALTSSAVTSEYVSTQNVASNTNTGHETAVTQRTKINLFCSTAETDMVNNSDDCCIPAHLHLQV